MSDEITHCTHGLPLTCPQCRGAGGWETGPHSESCKRCEGRGIIATSQPFPTPADITEAEAYVAARGNYVDRKTVYLDAIHTRDAEVAALQAQVVLLSTKLAAIKDRARAHCEHCGWTDRFIDRDEAAAKIREHVKVCEKHPMFALKAELTAAKEQNERLREALQPFAKSAM